MKNKRLNIYIGIAFIVIGFAFLTKTIIGSLFMIIAGCLCIKLLNNKVIKYFIILLFVLGLLIALLKKPEYYSKFKHCENKVCEVVIIDKDNFYMFDGHKYEYDVKKTNGRYVIEVAGGTYIYSFNPKDDTLCYMSGSECLYKYEIYDK